jgi:hypothetical protein
MKSELAYICQDTYYYGKSEAVLKKFSDSDVMASYRPK